MSVAVHGTLLRPRRIGVTARNVVLALTVAAAIALIFTTTTHGQSATSFAARLGWVPIGGAERNDVAGRGDVTAMLSGTTLTITGHFEGLPAPATVARLHNGVAIGARGPAIADLSVTPAVAGRIEGQVALTASQLDDLDAGRLYVQVHSERGVAPDNSNLWGWLLQ